jgi:general secretion pathway protein G
VLKNNLYSLCTVIDEYTCDEQKGLQTLNDLVNDGYLRQIPWTPSPARRIPERSSWRTPATR